MLIFLKSLIVLCFLWLAFQDFKDKAFFTFLPVVILALGIVWLFQEQEEAYAYFVLKYNFIFLALLLLIGALLGAIKYGDFSTLRQTVGMGDILILFAIIPLFAPMLFRIVFISSSVCGILMAMLYLKVKNNARAKIPFAGLLSIISAILIIIEISTKLSLHHPELEL